MSDMSAQIDLLITSASNTSHIVNNHSNVIIDQIARVNMLEKVVAELQNTVYKLSDKLAQVSSNPTPTLKRKPEQDPELSPKKTKINTNLRDEYIERLQNGRNKSRAWQLGMSKYTSVSYNTQVNKWFWVSQIFDENLTYFKSRNEAEKHYEKILAKYNIPVEYIIRKGYDESQDEEEVD
jgi:hypothetical protein